MLYDALNHCIRLCLVLALHLLVLSYSCVAGEDGAQDSLREKKGLLILPVVYYTPETKFAGGVVGLQYFYTGHHRGARPCAVREVLIYTQRQQIIMQFQPRIYFDEDRYYFEGDVSFFKYPNKFYGVGADAPESAEETFTSQIIRVRPSLQRLVADEIYLGAIYDMEYHKILNTETGKQLAQKSIPGSEGGVVSGLGLYAIWDSRDNIFSATSGKNYLLEWRYYGRVFGSDFDFSHFLLDARQYLPVTTSSVLAMQMYFSLHTGSPPFQYLSRIGGDKRLRGYYEGRYIDKQLWEAQCEYRFPLWWKFGMVAFASAGQVASDPGKFQLRGIKSAIGGGLRFKYDEKERIFVRFDAGVAEGQVNFYLTINEAF